MNNKKEIKICSRCVLDSATPEIEFDEQGVCNYCKVHDALARDFPNDERGAVILKNIAEEIKLNGKNNSYDVVVGVSGGTDSTYLLHLCRELGLRPLAVHLDNGWNSEISVANLKNVLEALDVDLVTNVLYWEEFKDILLSHFKAALPWADGPTDIAIVSALYRAAHKYKVKYIFVGNNFRTEGRQPDEWTHTDGRQIAYVQKKFGTRPIKTFPNYTLFDIFYYTMWNKIKMVRPFYYIPFDKSEAKKLITQKYRWVDYGGHHHENIFTRYVIGVWLTKKFGIDKRKVTLSAYIRNGELKREDALKILQEPPYSPKLMKEDHEYVAKKLGVSLVMFDEIWKRPNKSFRDYPSYFPIYERFEGIANFVFKYILPFKPMMSYKLKTIGKQ